MSQIFDRLVLSQEDYRKLSALVAAYRTDLVATLEEEIGKATVLPEGQTAQGIVSMHSKVTVVDLDSGLETQLTLVYPHEANSANASADADSTEVKVSILAPMGVALIGLPVGTEYEWAMPGGKQKRFLVKRVE